MTANNMKTYAPAGHVDLVITHPRHVTVIEWKVIRIEYLQIEGMTTRQSNDVEQVYGRK